MYTKDKGREGKYSFGSKAGMGQITTLPPKNYMIRNDEDEIKVPNLINIYRHEYKAKHFRFGTTLPAEKYQKELARSAKHCTEMIKELNMTNEDLQWVGDEMVFSEEWPVRSKNFRIVQLNVNGLSFAKDNFKIDMYLQGIMALQADVAAMQEINLNLSNGRVRENFNKAMKRYDQRAAVQIAANKEMETKDTYRPGGNAVWSSGMYTGRITRKGQEKYGRWAYMVMTGKKMQEIMIISAYNTCRNAPEDGKTIAGQLVRAMHKDKNKSKYNLRQAFFRDIQEFILEETKKGTEIVLSMDANTSATAEELNTLKLNTNMSDVYTTKHPTKEHPRTYHRGSQCLDYILATPFISRGIEKVGYAPFYMMGKYDHRLLYVDLKWEYVFNHKVDVTQARGRKLSIKNRRITKLYLKTLTELEEKAGIYKGLEKIRVRMEDKKITKEERDYCIKKLKNYKTVMIQLMINANKVATKGKPKIFQWSKKLRNNGRQMRYWNDRKKCSDNGDPEGLHCKAPRGYKPPIATTHDEVMEQYHTIQIQWIKTKDVSAILHHRFMIDLIEHIEEIRGCSKETAQKLLYHQEASKAGHEKQSKYLKKRRKGLLTELLVPVPHTKDPAAHMLIHDEKVIERILLRRNKTKLSEATISPFCKGPLADLIDENGKCTTSTSIIDGTFNIERIDNLDIKNKKEVKMLMKELRRKRGQDGKMEEDVNTTIDGKDFQKMFNKKNEMTSCGPRGIIMPHWKMIAESEHLSTVQAKLMEAPFKHGFTYDEWEISVHCMLLKDELPFIHRLRIIQLFEGDMNGALQLLFGRRQMQYMEKKNLNSDATYGGRKGKGCHQALNRIQYTILYSRTMRQPLGLVDVDATGCFDRMVGRLLSLINQCNGMPQQAASCQAKVLHNMKHYVKTTRGTSENYIKRDKTTLLEGNGQGNAASVPGWHGHNEILCKVYKKLIHGSKITSPDKTIDFEQWLSSFIDDNKMLLSFDNTERDENIIAKCQQSLQSWEILLNITGGAVELSKCFITILQYSTNYKWHNTTPGVPRLITNKRQSKCIISREGEAGTEIKQQDVTKGVRLLGIKAAANGNYKQEYETRLEMSRTLAGRLATAPLNIGLSWQVYYCRWKPAITYCLPITTFSAIECKKIQSPFYAVLLPKLGINRNMPRALLHGSSQVAGLGLLNLEAEQIAMHAAGMVIQIRKNDRVGQTMRATIDALQLYLGIEAHFFTQQAHTLEHRPSRKESQLTYIWEELNMLGCTMVSTLFWTPTSQGENDISIIEAITKIKLERQGTVQHLNKKAIWYTNACRLYLQVTMLSDICTPCGKYLYQWAMDGNKQRDNEQILYPYQEKPPPFVWKIWRESILAAFLKGKNNGRYTLNKPLIYKHKEIITPWREKITAGMNLDEAISLLPEYIKEAIGTWNNPVDNGHQLIRDMNKDKTTSWTDGTVKNKIGAHSYTIRPVNDKDEYSLQGAGGTPGDAMTMTSLRAEHFGVFAIVILLDILTRIHDCREQRTHVHYTDSMAVINRLNDEQYMPDKKYDCIDYDIWKETEEAIKKANYIRLELRHVKGHQRETMHEINGKQGPLTREAMYNDWCDGQAERERDKHNEPAQLHYIEAAAVYIRTKRTLLTAFTHKAIYDKKTSPNAEEYVRMKLGMTITQQNMINWTALGAYFRKLAISQQVKVMKYIYDWQNVGVQKQLMQWANEDEYHCPYKCDQLETPMHYLMCKKAINGMSRICMEAINKWMIKVRTNHCVREQLMELLYDKLPISRIVVKVQYPKPRLFEQALQEQKDLGWKALMKGLISTTWGEIQEEEYKNIRERSKLEIWYTGTWWTKHLIKHIIFWALNEWQRRNEWLHNDIQQQEKEYKSKQCREAIIGLYQQQEDCSTARLKRYFKTPLIEKLQQKPERQQQWIETIRALRGKTTLQNSKNKL
jgi:exonuclease III